MNYQVRLKNKIQLKESMISGQLFRWYPMDGSYWGLINHHPVGIKQLSPTELVVESKSNMTKQLLNFLRDDDDVHQIHQDIIKDATIQSAVASYPGLRIFRQDPWECLITFLSSQVSNIPKINRTLELMARRWGTPIIYNNMTFYQFPSPEVLAKKSVRSLKSTSLGFRARYIHYAARWIEKAPHFFNCLKQSPYELARKELMTLLGVGPKVADCVLLFSLEKLEAFPVDVWVKKAMIEWYTSEFKMNQEEIARFGRSYFGPFAGYAQQFLFHHRRLHRVFV